jgi:adenine phosphoribosyltransferase
MGGLSTKDLKERLRSEFVWQGDRTDPDAIADMTGWWRDSEVLASLGPALADQFRSEGPTLVLGVASRGSLLGPLVAVELGIGFLEVRKNAGPASDSDSWRQVTTPPDYKDRHLRLGLPARHLKAGQRVVAVDDWIETGGQMLAARRLVEDTGATWVGLSVVVDGLAQTQVRRELGVRSLLHVREI